MSGSAKFSTWSSSPPCWEPWSSASPVDSRPVEREWISGWCWRCEEVDVPVLWLGPIQSLERGEAPFYCCLPCIQRMEALIAAHFRA